MSNIPGLARTVGIVSATAVLGALLTFVPQPVFAATCTISGTAGNDVLDGTAGDDVICGGGSDDTISGLGGNDTLLGGLGSDTLYGGDGSDVIDGGDGNDVIEGGSGNDVVTGALGTDAIAGGDGDDDLNGGNESDTITGDEGADTITAGTGADTVDGGEGADHITAGDGDDLVDGRGGSDIILAGDGADTVNGGDGDDNISGGNGNDTINADTGADTVSGDSGEDRISGGDGNDVIGGGIQNDRLVGDAGNDTITGVTGADYIDGGAGDDNLDGGNDADSVTGGDGTDTLSGGFGIDTLDGGNGDDQLDGAGEADTLLGGYGADHIIGGWGDDTLSGGPGPDSLDGSGGNDSCDGSTGVNTFAGCETQTQDPGIDPNPNPTPGPTPETDPSTWVDTDQDIMPDDVEIRFGSDPLLSDTDSDGLSDDQEFLALTTPAVSDSDDDGISDFLDDEDSDGSTNGNEFALGTNPIAADTDDDGLTDSQEAVHGANPLVVDTDGDGLTDSQEVSAGTDPTLADSDGDAVADGEEVIEKLLTFPESGATLEFSGIIGAAASVVLQSPASSQFDGIEGLYAPAVEVVADGPISGTLTIPFETEGIPEYAQLGIVHFDKETQTYDRPPVQTIDMEAGIATVATDDFSPFFLVDFDTFSSEMHTDVRNPDDEYFPWGYYRPADIVLAFNTADSLATSDPNNLVEPAINNFIDDMPAETRFSVMNYAAFKTLGFTSDKSIAKTAIANLDDNTDLPATECDRPESATDHTHLWCLLRTAFDAYEVGRQKIVIVFDDGTVERNDNWRSRIPIYGATHNGYDVYGIGLGPTRDDDTWDHAARSESEWNSVPVADLDDLNVVLQELADEFRSREIVADSDGDGISDYLERVGYATSLGKSIATDSRNADTDGDGLTDGEEIGGFITDSSYEFGGSGSYKPTSNPLKKDSDGDGLGDAQERDLGTHALLKDSDGDSLSDLTEVEEGFDPTLGDADEDTFWDDKEKADGTDPFSYDFDALGQAHAGFSGLVFGDAWDTDWARALNVTVNVASNGWYLIGQLGSGYLVLGDIRDMIYGVGTGHWLDAGGALLGVVPAVGDAARTAATVTKFASKSTMAVTAAIPIANALPQNIAGVVKQALAASPIARVARDIDIKNLHVDPPASNFDIAGETWTSGAVRIGRDVTQARLLDEALTELVRLKNSGSQVDDVRVNQHQVNIAGERVGINRPDLQYTLDGKRYYVEYDRPRCGNPLVSRRGDAHAHRLRANDPSIDFALQVVLVLAGDRCE
ncbi:hypothetical protein [Cryobacterium sp. LW097]|uniref:hypothetical protein n=1 Tax=Cryobacterium sp. LW097 TaxID=1978566 RepID=UPI0012490D7A|nr:hypothetical protein [Cryobacterium sp. LW097]